LRRQPQWRGASLKQPAAASLRCAVRLFCRRRWARGPTTRHAREWRLRRQCGTRRRTRVKTASEHRGAYARDANSSRPRRAGQQQSRVAEAPRGARPQPLYVRRNDLVRTSGGCATRLPAAAAPPGTRACSGSGFVGRTSRADAAAYVVRTALRLARRSTALPGGASQATLPAPLRDWQPGHDALPWTHAHAAQRSRPTRALQVRSASAASERRRRRAAAYRPAAAACPWRPRPRALLLHPRRCSWCRVAWWRAQARACAADGSERRCHQRHALCSAATPAAAGCNPYAGATARRCTVSGCGRRAAPRAATLERREHPWRLAPDLRRLYSRLRRSPPAGSRWRSRRNGEVRMWRLSAASGAVTRGRH
jgi:hypothetical protein